MSIWIDGLDFTLNSVVAGGTHPDFFHLGGMLFDIVNASSEDLSLGILVNILFRYILLLHLVQCIHELLFFGAHGTRPFSG